MDSKFMFDDEVMKSIKKSFAHVDRDPIMGSRLFFENAGGSLRLNSVLETASIYNAIPDSSARTYQTSKVLKGIVENGIEDIKLILNASNGTIAPFHTASKGMFEIIRILCEELEGDNIVTTSIEHPSSYDACTIYSEKTNKDLRIAKANKDTGRIDVKNIINLVDEHTAFISVIYTSNITGAIQDVKEISKQAKLINPDIIVVTDAVQYAAHGVIDVKELGVDVLAIAPYKIFGNRGIGFVYLSERVGELPHNKLISKNKDDWFLGSMSPAIYASFSKIIDHIVYIGEQYSDSVDRRELIVEGMKRIKLHEESLLYYLVHGTDKNQGLKNLENIKLYFLENTISERDPIIAMNFKNKEVNNMVHKYEEEDIIVCSREKTSDFSKRVLDEFGMDDIIRVSPIHCHSIEDIDVFLEVSNKLNEY